MTLKVASEGSTESGTEGGSAGGSEGVSEGGSEGARRVPTRLSVLDTAQRRINIKRRYGECARRHPLRCPLHT